MDRSTLQTWDGLVLLWVVLWAAFGVWTGVTIWQVADTGDTITNSGEALHSVGNGLESLGGVPVIGDRPAEIGREVGGAGQDIAVRGQQIKGQLHRLGLLLGIAVVGMPAAPVVGLYVPLRLSRRRDVVQLRRQLRDRPDDAGLDRYLADRARLTLPYAAVTAIADGQPDESERARDRRLADAELDRLGIHRPPRS